MDNSKTIAPEHIEAERLNEIAKIFKNRRISCQQIIPEFPSDYWSADDCIKYLHKISHGSEREKQEIPEENKMKNKDLLLAIIKKTSEILRYTSLDIIEDDDFMKKAIRIDWSCIWYAPYNIKNDRGLILEILESSDYNYNKFHIIRYVSEEIKDDKEIVIKVLKVYPSMIYYISERLQNDKELVLIAIQDGAYEQVDRKWFLDKDVALAAVKQAPRSFRVFPDEMRSDREIVLEAVKSNSSDTIMEYAPDFQDDEEIAKTAIQNNGLSLQYLSERLQNNKDIVRDAVKNNYYSIRYSSIELRKNKEFILDLLRDGPEYFDLEYLSEEIRSDREIVIEAVKKSDQNIHYASPELLNDRNFVMEILNLDNNYKIPRFLSLVSAQLQDDKEVVLKDLQLCGYDIEFASDRLKYDIEVVLEAAKNVSYNLEYFLKKLPFNVRNKIAKELFEIS